MLTVRRNLIGNIYERAAGGRREGRVGGWGGWRQSVRVRKKGKSRGTDFQDVKRQTRNGKDSSFI